MELLPADPYNAIRQIPTNRVRANRIEPLSWIAARCGGVSDPDSDQERWLYYYGPPGSVPALTWSQALAADSTNLVARKIVFVGKGSKVPLRGVSEDRHENPWSRWLGPQIYGVELHATAALNLIHAHWVRRVPWLVEFCGFVALFSAFCLWMFEARSERIWGIGGGAVAAILLMAVGAWMKHVLFSWATMVAIVFAATAWIAWANRFYLGKKPQLFISFRTQGLGETAALLMKESLARRRKQAFFSTENLEPGAELTKEIKEAIRQAHTFLIIFTPEYCSALDKPDGAWIRMEIDFARRVPMRRSFRASLADRWRVLRGREPSGRTRRRFQAVLVGWPASPSIRYPPGFEWIGGLKAQPVLTDAPVGVGAGRKPELLYEKLQRVVEILASDMCEPGQDLDAAQRAALLR